VVPSKVLAILLATLVMASATAVGQEGQVPNRAELRRALAAARTPADHARIAGYYRQTAQVYAQKQAEEERIAAKWQRQYEGWSKSPNPYRSAKNLAAYYGQCATSALAHAAEQDRLAGN
jgi:hypothetical protein